jgi:acyl-CoA hydrolase
MWAIPLKGTNSKLIFGFLLYIGIFRSNSLFLGANARKAVYEGRADTIPIFLCEIPHLFRRRILDIDVALVTVAPPDKHGFCSLGTSVDCTRSAIQNAKYIIGMDTSVDCTRSAIQNALRSEFIFLFGDGVSPEKK